MANANALGMVETKGLVGAIEAADAKPFVSTIPNAFAFAILISSNYEMNKLFS